jgi:hypothetical protein
MSEYHQSCSRMKTVLGRFMDNNALIDADQLPEKEGGVDPTCDLLFGDET